jgi:predicted ATPase
MLVDGLRIRTEVDPEAWPFTIPAVRHLLDHGVELTSPVVVLMGANGSGKSTIIEAIAEAYGIEVSGGHGGRKLRRNRGLSPLGDVLTLVRTKEGRAFKAGRAHGFFLRAETATEMLDYWTAEPYVGGYGGQHSQAVSHGESYLAAVSGRVEGAGLYLLDEAEGPLSFRSTLQLLYTLLDVVREDGGQVIYATHSPLVAGLPGAQVLELDDEGIHERPWDELELVELWRRYLERPSAFFD